MKPELSVLVLCLAAAACSPPQAPAPPAPAAAPSEPAQSPPALDIVPRQLALGPPAAPAATGKAPAAATSPPPAPGQRNIPLDQVDRATLEFVRSCTQRFYDGELDSLFERFSPEMRQQLGVAQLSQMREYVLAHYGKEQRVLGERAAVNDTYRGFVRWATFDKTPDVIEIIWYLKPDDSIGGFFVRPAKKPDAGKTGAAQDAGGKAGASG